MRKRSVKDPPWQRQIRNVIGCLAAAVVMMAGMTGQAWASDNFSGYTLNRYVFGENAYGKYAKDYVKDYHVISSSGSGNQGYKATVGGSFSYDCGYKLYLSSTGGSSGTWTAPNGLASNNYRTNSGPYVMTPAYAGLWTGRNYCSGSETSYTYQYTVTINHKWSNWTVTQSQTCTSGGSKYRTCSGCNQKETTTVGSALGHSWTGWESDGNNHWKRCTRCGTRTSQGAHSWGSYYSDTATCTAGGTKKHKCNTCGKEVTVSSSALGHVWPSNYTQNGGYLYKYCTRSGCNAQLEKKPISYSIKFNGNGATSGSMIGQGFAYGTAQNLSKNTFVRQNYEFLGWANDENATIPIYKDQQSVNNLTTTNNATINLYAVWKLSTTTIMFHDQGGTGGPGEVIWLIGSTQSPTAPRREGYNFSGWNTAEDGSGTAWPKDNVVQANITDYYAQWVSNEYTAVQESNLTTEN